MHIKHTRPYTTRRYVAVGIVLAIAVAALTVWQTSATGALRDLSRQYVHGPDRCTTVQACRDQLVRTRQAVLWQRQQRIKRLRKLYRPGVIRSIEYAATLYHVSASDMIGIADCETGGTFDPNAGAGSAYEGIFQLSSAHRSDPIIVQFGWTDPLAQALHTAHYISLHGEGEWQCKPDGSLRW